MEYQDNKRRIQQVMSQIASTVPTVKLESSLNYTEWYRYFISDALQLDADIYNFITDDDWQPPFDTAGWADYRSFLDSKLFVLLRFYVERHVWDDISLDDASGKRAMLTIVSRFGTLSYRDMVTLHFLPVLHGGDDLSDLWKLTMLSKACRKLTEEQHCGFETMCRFEKSIAMELARYFDRSKDPLSPAAVQLTFQELRRGTLWEA
jgi:hypothetical protein